MLEILIGAEWAAAPTRVWGVRPLSWEDGQSHLAACSQPPTQPTLLAPVSPELTDQHQINNGGLIFSIRAVCGLAALGDPESKA